MSSTISLTAFYDRLIGHDWFHIYADDRHAWRKGADEQAALERLAAASGWHAKLFHAVREWKMYAGPAVLRPEDRVAA